MYLFMSRDIDDGNYILVLVRTAHGITIFSLPHNKIRHENETIPNIT